MAAQFIDAVGVRHPLAGRRARIVCLVPSITELLVELGLGSRLVGRTGFCIHPREALKSISKVGGTKDVNLDKVRALTPTHVIVNVDENLRETAVELGKFVPHVIVTHPLAPEDNFALYRLLGGIFETPLRAEHLCDELAAALRVPVARARRRVLYLIWKDPWMTVSRDTYISRTLGHFNWWTEPGQAADRYPEIDLVALSSQVDEVLLSTEPFPFQAHHVDEATALCRDTPVRLIDGEMTSWYGSRAIAGLRYLEHFTRVGPVVAA